MPSDNSKVFRGEYEKIERHLDLLSGTEERIREEVEQDYRAKFVELKETQDAILEALKDKGVMDLLAKGARINPGLLHLSGKDISPSE